MQHFKFENWRIGVLDGSKQLLILGHFCQVEDFKSRAIQIKTSIFGFTDFNLFFLALLIKHIE